jgi:hypothetical protein
MPPTDRPACSREEPTATSALIVAHEPRLPFRTGEEVIKNMLGRAVRLGDFQVMAYRRTQLMQQLREVDFAGKAGLEVVSKQRSQIRQTHVRLAELRVAAELAIQKEELVIAVDKIHTGDHRMVIAALEEFSPARSGAPYVDSARAQVSSEEVLGLLLASVTCSCSGFPEFSPATGSRRIGRCRR